MAITYFGSASNPSDNGSLTTPQVTVTPPASMQTGDLVIAIAFLRYTDSIWDIDISVTGGQEWIKFTQLTGTDMAAKVWCCKFNGTWSESPQWDNTFYDTIPMSVVMHVFRRTGSSVDIDIDVMPTLGTFSAGSSPYTKTISGITTLHSGALVFATWITADDNTWDSLTTNWSSAGNAQYRNTGGSDLSIASAYRVFSSAGATGDVSMNQATNGGDDGLSLIMAFYEHSNTPFAAAPTVDVYTDLENGSNGDTLSTTILSAATHPASPGGTWQNQYTTNNNLTVSTTSEKSLGNTVVCGGTNYTDSAGTRGMKYDHNYGDTAGFFRLSLSAAKNAVSVGFAFKTNTPYQAWQAFSWNGFYDANATYAVFGWVSYQADYHLVGLETPWQESLGLWPGMPIYNDTWYWVTMKYDYTNARAYFAIYEIDNNMRQVGFTINHALATPAQITYVNWGCTGGGYAAVDAASHFDNLIIDWTNATFPLGPGPVASSGLSIPVAMAQYRQRWK